METNLLYILIISLLFSSSPSTPRSLTLLLSPVQAEKRGKVGRHEDMDWLRKRRGLLQISTLLPSYYPSFILSFSLPSSPSAWQEVYHHLSFFKAKQFPLLPVEGNLPHDSPCSGICQSAQMWRLHFFSRFFRLKYF